MFCWEMIFRITYFSLQGQGGICFLTVDSTRSINTDHIFIKD